LDVQTGITVGLQIAKGLQIAYDKGIFHLYLKPANILLRPNADEIASVGWVERHPPFFNRHYNYFINHRVMVGVTTFWVATLQMYKVSGFFGFKIYPVNPKILLILIQTI
jgi:serine/threonine protein kinase